MDVMSKALLKQHAEKAIKEREAQEKAIAEKILKSSPVIQPQLSSSPPISIRLTPPIVLPNNNAEDIAKAKLMAEQLKLENERIARQKEALEREIAVLKLKYKLVLEEMEREAIKAQDKQDVEDQRQIDQLAKLDEETTLSERRHSLALEESEQLVRKISQENDVLKVELEQLRSDNAEKKVSSEVLAQVLNVEETANIENIFAPPPVYVDNAMVLLTPTNNVILSGEAEEPDNTSPYCSIS